MNWDLLYSLIVLELVFWLALLLVSAGLEWLGLGVGFLGGVGIILLEVFVGRKTQDR